MSDTGISRRGQYGFTLGVAAVMAGFWIVIGYGIDGPQTPVPDELIYGGAVTIFLAISIVLGLHNNNQIEGDS